MGCENRVSGDSIFRPAFVLMSGRVVGFVAAFAIPVVLARLLDQAAYGTYKQLFLVYGTLYSIAQLGMAESLFYFLPAAERNGGRYLANSMLVLGLSGAACAIILWCARHAVAHWLNNAALTSYLPLLSAYLMLMLTAAVLEIVMTVRKRHFHAFISYALTDLSRAALFIVPVVWSGRLTWLLYGAIAVAALRVAASVIYLRRQYPRELRPDSRLVRSQMHYAVPFSLYVLVEVAQTNLHQYAVSYHFDTATFAIYSVGCLSIPLVDFLTGSAGNVMMVRMREHLVDGSPRAVREIWCDTTRKLMLIFAPLVGGLLVVAQPLIVGLFTLRYQASVPVFMVWTIITLFAGLLTDSVLRVYSQIGFLMMLGIVKLALIAAGIGWFLSNFGLLGAVLVVLLTTVISKTLALARIKSVMRCKLEEFLPWRSLLGLILCSAAAALPALWVKSLLPLPPLLSLMAIAPAYGGAYLLILWHFDVLSIEEKRALTGWWPWAAKVAEEGKS